MKTGQIVEHVLAAYPNEFLPEDVIPFDPISSLGFCKYWKIETLNERFCLRQWPKGNPTKERLQFLQAVQWTAVFEGLSFIPLPLETTQHKGFVEFGGSFWELLPWIETKTKDTREFQIISAMMALAQFHLSVSNFPLPDSPVSTSSRIYSILTDWENGLSSRISRLYQILQKNGSDFATSTETRLAKAGLHFLGQIFPLMNDGVPLLMSAARLQVPVQPVIGNAVLRHVCFDEDGVCGMFDFKEIAVDSVAKDIASLLGSIAEADLALWMLGLNAYQSIRPLSEDELFLIRVFNRTEIVIEGFHYLSAVFEETNWLTHLQLSEIQRRVESFVLRLEDEKRNRNIA